MSYKAKLKNIKAFVFDVDGVFTDGSVYLMPDKSMCRVMNVLDGYAVVKAIKNNYKICVITGGDVKKELEHKIEEAVSALFMWSENFDFKAWQENWRDKPSADANDA